MISNYNQQALKNQATAARGRLTIAPGFCKLTLYVPDIGKKEVLTNGPTTARNGEDKR
jgi:hypothetical protein